MRALDIRRLPLNSKSTSALARPSGRVPGAFAALRTIGWLPVAALLLGPTGCVVHQPRGEGTLQRIIEPSTARSYYLYLPKEYVAADETQRAARCWPVVVTFHGMKPYDVALFQAQEWEQEADRYGYVVVAPELKAFDFLTGEFPLRTINRDFKSDELATLAILDYVFERTHADPNNVLSTSWSSGGYMAHYMLNRHPDRFTCLAVRQSNFSASVLDPTLTAQSLYHPVLVLTTQNDIPVCKEESQEAIRWYESHGYKNFAWVHMKRLGHERTPDTAADFFARVSGVTPNRPPRVLVERQAIDGNPTGLALLAGHMGQIHRPPGLAAEDGVSARTVRRPPTQRRPIMVARSGGPQPPTASATEESTPPPGEPTPTRRSLATTPRAAPAPVGIRVSSAIGFNPLLLVYSAECPADWQRTASFRWTLDGKEIGQAVNGQRTIPQPGDYLLELVVTRDGAEHRAARRIRVLKNLETTAVPTPIPGQ
jgi:poly(3-hydroxybutyrate) depolymerase